MACKKPLISTCFGGSSEAIIDGETGYIVNPYNVAVMAEKITELLEDKSEGDLFGQKGYKRVKEEFSLIKHVESYEEEFDKKL